MEIQIPQHHTFSLLVEEFSRVRNYTLPEWEISVPQKDSLAWSIVLHHLITAKFTEENDFANRLITLTGISFTDNDVKSAGEDIRKYNPFRDRLSIFYKDTFKEIVSKFKNKLNWNSLTNISDKLLAISQLLNCQIFVICKIDNNIKLCCFPENVMQTTENDTVLLASSIKDENLPNSGSDYNFMLSGGFCVKLKHSALLHIFRETPIKDSSKVVSIVNNEEHFLISLLNNNMDHVISDIYKLPHLVSKLSNACYKTDPKSSDTKGFSSFYYALIKGNTALLYELYFFAANNCYESKGTFRNPDSRVIDNLHEIQNILRQDLIKFTNFKDFKNRNSIENSFNQLLKLNQFLAKIASQILTIRKRVNNSENVLDDEYKRFEVNKRRDIIVAILNTYKEFFMYTNCESALLHEDYHEHMQYYYWTDVVAALCFYDNILYLKERLPLDNNIFHEMEESFLFLVSFQVIFHKCIYKKWSNATESLLSALNLSDIITHISKYLVLKEDNISNLYTFSLMQRQAFISKMEQFNKTLQNTVVSRILKNVPKREICGILQSHSEIKDHAEITRLKEYISSALKVEVNTVQSVLVIERALQVLGEHMNAKTDDDSFSIQVIFPMCLPNNIADTLRKIRKNLTHLPSHRFPSRFEWEKDDSLFQGIQEDIKFIGKKLHPVFEIQNFRVILYALINFDDEWKRIIDSTYLHNNENISSLQTEIVSFSRLFSIKDLESYEKSFFLVFDLVLKNADEGKIMDAIKTKYVSTTEEGIEIEEKALQTEYSTIQIEKIKVQIEKKLWHLKCLLELSQGMSDSIKAKTIVLLKMVLNIKEYISFVELEKGVDSFIIKCNEFIKPHRILEKYKKSENRGESCKFYLKVLKGLEYFSLDVKQQICNEIPDSIKESVKKKYRLIASIEQNDFSLTMEEQCQELDIKYLSKKTIETLKDFYMVENGTEVLNILKKPDPISILEYTFSEHAISKTEYNSLCKVIEFSKQTKRVLWKLVKDQNKKIIANKLPNVLNRIQLLRKILLEPDTDLSKIWKRIQSRNGEEKEIKLLQQFFIDKTVKSLLNDHALQASVEMLLFDCMNLIGVLEDSWIKSSKMYGGINIRNVMAHGSPLLQILCNLLDPSDFLSEEICRIMRLIEVEVTIASILELYEIVDCEQEKLRDLINLTEPDKYEDLREKILKVPMKWECYGYQKSENCKLQDWKYYVSLLSDKNK